MIIVSPDVVRDNSNIPPIPGAVVSTLLEELTGADMMVSKLDIPAGKEALLREHIANRALLVQVKIGADYPSSFGNRLHMSQAKMKEACASPQQRWLVTVGVYTRLPDGELAINSVPASKLIPGQRYTFKAANTAARSWQLRGGCYHNCYNGERLIEWIVEAEEWLKSNQPEVVYAMPELPDIFEETNDAFQMLRRITDGRLTLCTLPGIGPEKSQSLWELSGGNLAVAVDYLLGDYELVKGNGVGKGIRAKVKQFFGSRLELATNTKPSEGDY